MQVYLDLLGCAVSQASTYMQRGEYCATAQMLTSLESLVGHAQQLSITANIGTEEIEDLQVRSTPRGCPHCNSCSVYSAPSHSL